MPKYIEYFPKLMETTANDAAFRDALLNFSSADSVVYHPLLTMAEKVLEKIDPAELKSHELQRYLLFRNKVRNHIVHEDTPENDKKIRFLNETLSKMSPEEAITLLKLKRKPSLRDWWKAKPENISTPEVLRAYNIYMDYFNNAGIKRNRK